MFVTGAFFPPHHQKSTTLEHLYIGAAVLYLFEVFGKHQEAEPVVLRGEKGTRTADHVSNLPQPPPVQGKGGVDVVNAIE